MNAIDKVLRRQSLQGTKILFAGSLRAEDGGVQPTDDEVREYICACNTLGAAFAGAGCQIVVGAPSGIEENGTHAVPGYILWGYRAAVAASQGKSAPDGVPGFGEVSEVKWNKAKLVNSSAKVYLPRTPTHYTTPAGDLPDVDTAPDCRSIGDQHELEKMRLNDKLATDTFKRADTVFSIVDDVKDVDAVALIGGGQSTSALGAAALSFGKPVVTITRFGRAASQLAEGAAFDDYEAMQKVDPRLDPACLTSVWDKGGMKENIEHADQVVDFTTRLIGAHRAADVRNSRVVGQVLALLTGLMLLWILTYVFTQFVTCSVGTFGQSFCNAAPTLIFFLLLFLAAALGSGLRTLGIYQSDAALRLTWPQVWLDIVVALLIAFALSLFYLVGAISYNTHVVILGSGTEAGLRFATVSLTMSLLGLAAGYLVPLNAVRSRLEKLVASDSAGGES